MATVKFPSEMSPATSIGGNDKLMISKESTGEAYQATFNQAKDYLAITGIELEPLVGGTTSGTALVVPNGPAGEQRTAEVASGLWYNFGSGPVQADASKRWKAYWNGSSWSLKDMGALPVTPVSNSFGSSVSDAISQAKATETNNKVNDVTERLEDSIVTPIDVILLGGSYNTTNGAFVAGVNWLSADIMNIPANTDKINLSGYGMFSSAQTNRILWFSPTAFLNVQSSGTANSFEATPPLGATRFAVQVQGGTGVGSDPANSPYNDTFKVSAKSVVQESTFLKGERIKGEIDTTQIRTMESDIDELKNNQPKGESIRFEYPNTFSFRPFPIVREFDQYRFDDSFSGVESEFINGDKAGMTAYYIDPVNGRDTNTGERTSPFQTIRAAVETKGARWLKLMNCNKFYPRNSNFSLWTLPSFTEPLIIEAEDGANVVMANSDRSDAFTWTNEGGSIYKANRSQVIAVIDTTRTNSKGYFVHLTKRNSLADLQAATDGFFTDGASVYIKHTAEPTTEFEICLNVLQKIIANGQKYIFLKGITFYTNSGLGGIEFNNNLTTQHNTKVYLKNVVASENKVSNGIAINNIKEAWLESCGGYGHTLDSLNYHSEVSGYEKMKVVEINCFGGNNGIGTTQLSSNGSTAHDGISIIRMGGSFEMCMGPVIADVSDNGKSLNFNVVAKDSVLEGGANFQNSGVNNEMWLYGCKAYNSTAGKFATRSYGGAITYIGDYNRLIGDMTGDIKEVL